MGRKMQDDRKTGREKAEKPEKELEKDRKKKKQTIKILK